MLSEIATSFEQVWQEREELEKKLGELEAALPEVTELERRLRNSLVTAERAGELVRQAARQEAELMLRAARERAEKLGQESEKRKAQLEGKSEKIEASARRRMRALMDDVDRQRDLLEAKIEDLRAARLGAWREYDEALAAAIAWLRDELEKEATTRPSRPRSRGWRDELEKEAALDTPSESDTSPAMKAATGTGGGSNARPDR